MTATKSKYRLVRTGSMLSGWVVADDKGNDVTKPFMDINKAVKELKFLQSQEKREVARAH